MRTSTAYLLCVCVLFATLINWQWRFAGSDAEDATTYALELRAKPSRATHVQVYYDNGSGYAEDRSVRVALPEAGQFQTARLPLPRGVYRSLRIDPFEGEGSVVVESIRLVDSSDRVLTTFSARDFRPAHHVLSVRPQGEHGMTIVSTPGDADPQIETTRGPIDVPPEALGTKLARLHLGRGALIALALSVLLLALDRLAPLTRAIDHLARWAHRRPRIAIAAVAIVAVVASAYPVVFLGQSYVSPNGGTTLLYGSFPTLPGATSDRLLNTQGSDVGAIMWQHVPYAAIQHRALAGGEWPLWNRYTSGGTPLLGQGQSMFGDPLHWLPIAFNSAACAWDVKYLLAKALLALGLGLCVWTLTAALPASALVAAASPFIGFFIYRQNHPAIFSFCYAPWILLGWLTLAQSTSRRQRALGGLLLFIANSSTLTSGTVKEAYALLLGLNACGLAVLVFGGGSQRVRLSALGWATMSVLLSAAATVPVWATFFQTLRNAHTTYQQSVAYQIQPALLLGAFDELFYRPLSSHHFVYNPALNLLLGFGLLYYVASAGAMPRKQSVVVLAIASLLPLALVYGVVPPTWIVHIPLLRNIWHIDNSFGCVLLILWAVLAGVGFAQFRQDLERGSWKPPLVRVAALLAIVIALWSAYFQVVGKPALFEPTFTPSRPTNIPNAFWIYLLTLIAALGLWVWGCRLRRKRPATGGLVCALMLSAAALLWRQGAQSTKIGSPDIYVVQPTERTDFHARSAAVEHLQERPNRYPGRVVGMSGAFFPGWGAVYGLESPGGVDALSSRYYAELVGQFPDWEIPLPADRAKLDRLQPLLDLLNIKSYLSDRENKVQPSGAARILGEKLDLNIDVSVRGEWPRAFFTDRLGTPGDITEFATALRQSAGRPFAAVEASERPQHPSLATISADLATRTISDATDYQLSENGLEFSITANGHGMAVAIETYWPRDVQATVNGRPTPVIRTNHAFRGVEIPAAGLYRVRFEYVPAHFSLYTAIGAIGLFSALALFGWGAWKKPLEPRTN